MTVGNPVWMVVSRRAPLALGREVDSLLMGDSGAAGSALWLLRLVSARRGLRFCPFSVIRQNI